jgi:hypothetical protein
MNDVLVGIRVGLQGVLERASGSKVHVRMQALHQATAACGCFLQCLLAW